MCVPLFSSDPRYAFVFHQVTFVWVLGNNSAQMSSSQNRGIQGKSCATQSCHDCVTMVLGKSGLLVADHASVNAFRVIIGEILTEKKVLATDQKKKEKKKPLVSCMVPKGRIQCARSGSGGEPSAGGTVHR